MAASAYVDISDLVGIPFVDRGRTKDGADCWGLFLMVTDRYGYKVPDVSVSAFATETICEEMISQLPLWIPVESPMPGDAVAMSTDHNLPGTAQHFGVYIGDGKFIHTMKKIGSMVARLDHPLWKNKILGYYRWAG